MRSVCFFTLCLVSTLHADSFHVAPDGKDEAGRGSKSKPWASLAFACEQVPEGKHAIHLAPGDYLATRTAYAKSGFTIIGRKQYGKDRTRLMASKDWPLGDAPVEGKADEYLISFEKAENVTIKNLAFVSDPEHRINGAIRAFRSTGVTLKELAIEEFRWAGIHAEILTDLTITHCRLHNASTDRSRYWGGLIRAKYLKNAEIAHCRITSDTGGGYGYKGGGHTGMRFHHNFVDVKGGFAFESPHENEFGVEIDHNYLTKCMSIPKGVQSPDPNQRGFEHTFHIHHNYLTDSYTIEGPRNHLRVNNNWIRIAKPNGRVYTHHGGTNEGPIWFHHNVVENVDRSLIWMNNGIASGIHIYNNTIVCADAGPRTGFVLGVGSGEKLGEEGWSFKNNVVVAAWSQARKLFREENGVPEKIDATHNLLINVTNPPAENLSGVDPGFMKTDEKPTPFYLPASQESAVVDQGIDVGFTHHGDAPDLGAFEFGVEPWKLEGIPKPR
ncbi:MAG: hypothetical protein AAGA58_09410 [Verrucomicrobiota bacterium]